MAQYARILSNKIAENDGLAAENAPISLDALDSKILAALQEDGRLSNVELADRVGLSPSPCLRRVKRLEEEGYIAGYKAKVDRRRLGLGMTVFVGVKFDTHRDANARRLPGARCRPFRRSWRATWCPARRIFCWRWLLQI